MRVAADLLQKLRVVAVHRGVMLGELVDPVLRPWVETEFKRAVQEMTESVGQGTASEG